ncbi:hypothetical protein C942_03231 [Photobacterium marinum]|uniref:Uncharacterized protein n=1 Tax=Photobacterium marinum TaxID=1056511 RepID=L8J8U5_9GAMM|nr:hypothetical protein C942_03231 [Photobacterium marinum]
MASFCYLILLIGLLICFSFLGRIAKHIEISLTILSVIFSHRDSQFDL